MTGGLTEHLDALEAAISKRPMTERETAVMREIVLAEQWCVSLFQQVLDMRTGGGYATGSVDELRKIDASQELNCSGGEFRAAFDRLKKVLSQPHCPWVGLR